MEKTKIHRNNKTKKTRFNKQNLKNKVNQIKIKQDKGKRAKYFETICYILKNILQRLMKYCVGFHLIKKEVKFNGHNKIN